MKKIINNRFELVFTLSLVAILGLPPLVLAQDTKSIEIQINNGDTTVNGKNIKKMTPDERKEALGEINKMGNLTFDHMGKDGNRDIVIRRNSRMRRGDKDAPPPPPAPHMFGNGDNASSPYTMDFYGNGGDSIRRGFRMQLRKIPGGDSVMAFRFDDKSDFGPDGPQSFRMDGPPRGFNGGEPMRLRFKKIGPMGNMRDYREFDGKNTQQFNYSSTDNDGITNQVNFSIADARKEAIKRVAGVDKAALNVNDLNLSPEFSTGKTLISFNLPAKTTAEVNLTDSEGRSLWSDKATAGSFMKKVTLPRNGIYFLVVKQGSNVGVKRIVKE